MTDLSVQLTHLVVDAGGVALERSGSWGSLNAQLHAND